MYVIIINKNNNIKRNDIITVDCDSIITNTGELNGVIRFFQNKFQRLLESIIGMLYLNVWKFGHPFNNLDGVTTISF